MKIKDGFILKDVAGSKIVIATGSARLNFNGVITFNDVGADVFALLDGTKTVDEIADLLGISSTSYFCKLFRSKNQMSPSDYKRLNMNQGG